MDGQQRHIRQQGLLNDRSLRTSRVLVIGAGGLGSPLLYYLAAAGVGSIVVCDGDPGIPVGPEPADPLRRRGRGAEQGGGGGGTPSGPGREPDLRAEPVYFTEETASGLLENCSLVALAVDRLEVRRLANRLCVAQGIPLTDAGVSRWSGYTVGVIPGRTPCLECWLGACRQEEPCQNVAGPAAGLLGAAEAMLALRILSGDRAARRPADPSGWRNDLPPGVPRRPAPGQLSCLRSPARRDGAGFRKDGSL